MTKEIYTWAKRGLNRLLPLTIAVSLLAFMAVITISLPNRTVEAEDIKKNDYAGIHGELGDAEAPLEELRWEVPEGQEIILIENPATGLQEKSLTTGTNDFYISVQRDAYGKWVHDKKIIIEDDDGRNIENLLIDALDREWELKMPIPDEVREKMQEGYKVGIAVADAKEVNLMGGTNAEEVWRKGIDKVPSNPVEARKFFRGNGLELGDLSDPDSQMTIKELFDLEKSHGILQYKLEDEYLYIIGWPKIRLRHNFYYSSVIGDLPPIPLVEGYCGGSTHIIYNQADLDEPAGSTSTVVYNVDVLRENPDTAILNAELKIAEGAGYIHFRQIQTQNAKGGFIYEKKTSASRRFTDSFARQRRRFSCGQRSVYLPGGPGPGPPAC
jgi:hypothetical protein